MPYPYLSFVSGGGLNEEWLDCVKQPSPAGIPDPGDARTLAKALTQQLDLSGDYTYLDFVSNTDPEVVRFRAHMRLSGNPDGEARLFAVNEKNNDWYPDLLTINGGFVRFSYTFPGTTQIIEITANLGQTAPTRPFTIDIEIFNATLEAELYIDGVKAEDKETFTQARTVVNRFGKNPGRFWLMYLNQSVNTGIILYDAQCMTTTVAANPPLNVTVDSGTGIVSTDKLIVGTNGFEIDGNPGAVSSPINHFVTDATFKSNSPQTINVPGTAGIIFTAQTAGHAAHWTIHTDSTRKLQANYDDTVTVDDIVRFVNGQDQWEFDGNGTYNGASNIHFAHNPVAGIDVSTVTLSSTGDAIYPHSLGTKPFAALMIDEAGYVYHSHRDLDRGVDINILNVSKDLPPGDVVYDPVAYNHPSTTGNEVYMRFNAPDGATTGVSSTPVNNSFLETFQDVNGERLTVYGGSTIISQPLTAVGYSNNKMHQDRLDANGSLTALGSWGITNWCKSKIVHDRADGTPYCLTIFRTGTSMWSTSTKADYTIIWQRYDSTTKEWVNLTWASGKPWHDFFDKYGGTAAKDSQYILDFDIVDAGNATSSSWRLCILSIDNNNTGTQRVYAHCNDHALTTTGFDFNSALINSGYSLDTIGNGTINSGAVSAINNYGVRDTGTARFTWKVDSGLVRSMDMDTNKLTSLGLSNPRKVMYFNGSSHNLPLSTNLGRAKSFRFNNDDYLIEWPFRPEDGNQSVVKISKVLDRPGAISNSIFGDRGLLPWVSFRQRSVGWADAIEYNGYVYVVTSPYTNVAAQSNVRFYRIDMSTQETVLLQTIQSGTIHDDGMMRGTFDVGPSGLWCSFIVGNHEVRGFTDNNSAGVDGFKFSEEYNMFINTRLMGAQASGKMNDSQAKLMLLAETDSVKQIKHEYIADAWTASKRDSRFVPIKIEGKRTPLLLEMGWYNQSSAGFGLYDTNLSTGEMMLIDYFEKNTIRAAASEITPDHKIPFLAIFNGETSNEELFVGALGCGRNQSNDEFPLYMDPSCGHLSDTWNDDPEICFVWSPDDDKLYLYATEVNNGSLDVFTISDTTGRTSNNTVVPVLGVGVKIITHLKKIRCSAGGYLRTWCAAIYGLPWDDGMMFQLVHGNGSGAGNNFAGPTDAPGSGSYRHSDFAVSDSDPGVWACVTTSLTGACHFWGYKDGVGFSSRIDITSPSSAYYVRNALMHYRDGFFYVVTFLDYTNTSKDHLYGYGFQYVVRFKASTWERANGIVLDFDKGGVMHAPGTEIIEIDGVPYLPTNMRVEDKEDPRSLWNTPALIPWDDDLCAFFDSPDIPVDYDLVMSFARTSQQATGGSNFRNVALAKNNGGSAETLVLNTNSGNFNSDQTQSNKTMGFSGDFVSVTTPFNTKGHKLKVRSRGFGSTGVSNVDFNNLVAFSGVDQITTPFSGTAGTWEISDEWASSNYPYITEAYNRFSPKMTTIGYPQDWHPIAEGGDGFYAPDILQDQLFGYVSPSVIPGRNQKTTGKIYFEVGQLNVDLSNPAITHLYLEHPNGTDGVLAMKSDTFKTLEVDWPAGYETNSWNVSNYSRERVWGITIDYDADTINVSDMRDGGFGSPSTALVNGIPDYNMRIRAKFWYRNADESPKPRYLFANFGQVPFIGPAPSDADFLDSATLKDCYYNHYSGTDVVAASSVYKVNQTTETFEKANKDIVFIHGDYLNASTLVALPNVLGPDTVIDLEDGGTKSYPGLLSLNGEDLDIDTSVLTTDTSVGLMVQSMTASGCHGITLETYVGNGIVGDRLINADLPKAPTAALVMPHEVNERPFWVFREELTGQHYFIDASEEFGSYDHSTWEAGVEPLVLIGTQDGTVTLKNSGQVNAPNWNEAGKKYSIIMFSDIPGSCNVRVMKQIVPGLPDTHSLDTNPVFGLNRSVEVDVSRSSWWYWSPKLMDPNDDTSPNRGLTPAEYWRPSGTETKVTSSFWGNFYGQHRQGGGRLTEGTFVDASIDDNGFSDLDVTTQPTRRLFLVVVGNGPMIYGPGR